LAPIQGVRLVGNLEIHRTTYILHPFHPPRVGKAGGRLIQNRVFPQPLKRRSRTRSREGDTGPLPCIPARGCEILSCRRANTGIRLGIPRFSIQCWFHSNPPFWTKEWRGRQSGGNIKGLRGRREDAAQSAKNTSLFVRSEWQHTKAIAWGNLAVPLKTAPANEILRPP